MKLTSQPCRPNDLGTYLIPAWDAVLLADALLRDPPPPGRDYLASLETERPVTLATGIPARVHRGELVEPVIPVRLWHVDPLNDPSRIWERPSQSLRLPTDSASGVPDETF